MKKRIMSLAIAILVSGCATSGTGSTGSSFANLQKQFAESPSDATYTLAYSSAQAYDYQVYVTEKAEGSYIFSESHTIT